jgi:hypothetical protein
MAKTVRAIALLTALLGVAAAAGAAEDELAASLRGVVEANLKGYDAEDVDGALKEMHSASPEYGPTRTAMTEQFRDLDVSAELVDFRYIGHDDEFAVARVKIKLTGPHGSGFQDNVTDNVILFHQEGGVWKLWSDEVLGVELVAP